MMQIGMAMLLLTSLFLQGQCVAESPNCIYSECCEEVGDSCTVQPQGLNCEETSGGLDCFDMGNTGCHAYYSFQECSL